MAISAKRYLGGLASIKKAREEAHEVMSDIVTCLHRHLSNLDYEEAPGVQEDCRKVLVLSEHWKLLYYTDGDLHLRAFCVIDGGEKALATAVASSPSVFDRGSDGNTPAQDDYARQVRAYLDELIAAVEEKFPFFAERERLLEAADRSGSVGALRPA